MIVTWNGMHFGQKWWSVRKTGVGAPYGVGFSRRNPNHNVKGLGLESTLRPRGRPAVRFPGKAWTLIYMIDQTG